jgi:hypothetical protein
MVPNLPLDDEVTQVCAWNSNGLLCATTAGRVRALLPSVNANNVAVSTTSSSLTSSTSTSSSSVTESPMASTSSNQNQQQHQQHQQHQHHHQHHQALIVVHEFQCVTRSVEQLVFCAPQLYAHALIDVFTNSTYLSSLFFVVFLLVNVKTKPLPFALLAFTLTGNKVAPMRSTCALRRQSPLSLRVLARRVALLPPLQTMCLFMRARCPPMATLCAWCVWPPLPMRLFSRSFSSLCVRHCSRIVRVMIFSFFVSSCVVMCRQSALRRPPLPLRRRCDAMRSTLSIRLSRNRVYLRARRARRPPVCRQRRTFNLAACLMRRADG